MKTPAASDIFLRAVGLPFEPPVCTAAKNVAALRLVIAFCRLRAECAFASCAVQPHLPLAYHYIASIYFIIDNFNFIYTFNFGTLLREQLRILCVRDAKGCPQGSSAAILCGFYEAKPNP